VASTWRGVLEPRTGTGMAKFAQTATRLQYYSPAASTRSWKGIFSISIIQDVAVVRCCLGVGG
jgi:hypothetical protein